MRLNRSVVLEGPDGCGKTNIGHALAVATGSPYFKMVSEVENWRKNKFKEALEFDQTYLAEFLKQTGHHTIIDRAWPSEYVYSRVFGRNTNNEVLRQVDHIHAGIGTVIVMPLRRDYRNNRYDDLIANETLPEIHAQYLEFTKWTRCKVIQLYVDDLDNNLTRELEYIHSRFKDL